ncbi:ABC transporter permease subunit [Mesorhizobium sp. M7A.F.Ca.CA.001.09.2.1]
MLSFLSLLLALMLVTLVGPGMLTLVFMIGISYVPVFGRLTRSAVMVVSNRDFVTASRSFGATDARTMRRTSFRMSSDRSS